MTDVSQPRAWPPVWLAYLAAFLGVCGHASSEFFVKLSGIAGAEVSVWRFMIGGVALVLVCLARADTRDLVTPLRENFVPIAALSVLGMAFGQFIFHIALDYASVVQVATMITVMPIATVFVARVLQGTRVSPAKLVSGIGAFCGCMLLLTDGYIDQLTSDGDSLVGILMALGSALIGAVYIVLIKPYIGRYGAVRMTTYTFALGFLVLWPVVGVMWGSWVNPAALWSMSSVQVGSVLALGIWNTCIGFILWLWGLANVPDLTRGNYLFFLKPVIAALLAAMILGDTITVPQLGAIIVITGFVAAEIFYEDIRRWLSR